MTGPLIQMQIPSQARFLAPVRAFMGGLAERMGFSGEQGCRMSLALDEALCNVINHGYDRAEDGTITLAFSDRENGRPCLKIVIEDDGRQVDPADIKSRDLDEIRPGGLGVHIIREIMDEVLYERRESSGMRLTLVKYVPPVHSASATSNQGIDDHE